MGFARIEKCRALLDGQPQAAVLTKNKGCSELTKTTKPGWLARLSHCGTGRRSLLDRQARMSKSQLSPRLTAQSAAQPCAATQDSGSKFQLENQKWIFSDKHKQEPEKHFLCKAPLQAPASSLLPSPIYSPIFARLLIESFFFESAIWKFTMRRSMICCQLRLQVRVRGHFSRRKSNSERTAKEGSTRLR